MIDLEAIRGRNTDDANMYRVMDANPHLVGLPWRRQMHDDRAALLAEVDRLKALCELGAEVLDNTFGCCGCNREEAAPMCAELREAAK